MSEEKTTFTYTSTIDFSFKILEKILLLKEYESRDDVLRVAQTMARMAMDNKDFSEEVKSSYVEAFEKLNILSFEEMKEIIEILRV